MRLFDDKQLYPLLLQNDFSKIMDFLAPYEIDSRDRGGRSFLMSCISENKNSFAKNLISEGADYNISDNKGFTPLMLSIISHNIEMTDFLLQIKEIDIHSLNKYGKNALDIVLQHDPENTVLMLQLLHRNIDSSRFIPILMGFHSGDRTIGVKE